MQCTVTIPLVTISPTALPPTIKIYCASPMNRGASRCYEVLNSTTLLVQYSAKDVTCQTHLPRNSCRKTQWKFSVWRCGKGSEERAEVWYNVPGVMLPSWLWELRSNIWRHVVTACRKVKQRSEIKPSRTENNRIWFKYILYVDLPNTLQEIKNLCFMNWLQSLAWTGGVKVRLRLWRSRDKWGWNNSETGNGIMGERKEEIAVHDEAE